MRKRRAIVKQLLKKVVAVFSTFAKQFWGDQKKQLFIKKKGVWEHLKAYKIYTLLAFFLLTSAFFRFCPIIGMFFDKIWHFVQKISKKKLKSIFFNWKYKYAWKYTFCQIFIKNEPDYVAIMAETDIWRQIKNTKIVSGGSAKEAENGNNINNRSIIICIYLRKR